MQQLNLFTRSKALHFDLTFEIYICIEPMQMFANALAVSTFRERVMETAFTP